MFSRSSGLLLHITSLPSPYGIGDMGPAAYSFADFLKKAGQKWWQILPTNQVGEKSNYSPYSGLSAFAGNVLLISPDLLVEEGYIDHKTLKDCGPEDLNSGFKQAQKFKNRLLEQAYHNWKEGSGQQNKAYQAFFQKNSYWLNDYALYNALRTQYGDSWLHWPAGLKNRTDQAIRTAHHDFAEEIDKTYFQQYLFYTQWHALKHYCAKKDIQLFGDMPIYVDHESCDVWVHPELFDLDAEGNMRSVAGVPPDYFSEDGQLWNMPIYDWDVHNKNDFQWWGKRISHNLDIYDVLRLDHFRAFADYWEVPAGEATARNGRWVPGPGNKLFDKLKRLFPDMPIIAEDLGEIDQPVHDLMDSYGLPGMRVIQFAWGGEVGENPHIPHNYVSNQIAYTGTHDNLPVRAWYAKQNKAIRRQVDGYTGQKTGVKSINRRFISLVWQSVACIAITTIQDLLGLGEEGIMNIPGTVEGNWVWRLDEGMLTDDVASYLKQLTICTGR